jgi:hypothetical protein
MILDGIAYLQSLGFGNCGVPAGPRVCSRISCSYDSGIWLCNDNAWHIQPSCTYLASYAEDIVSRCASDCVNGICANVNGQVRKSQLSALNISLTGKLGV